MYEITYKTSQYLITANTLYYVIIEIDDYTNIHITFFCCCDGEGAKVLVYYMVLNYWLIIFFNWMWNDEEYKIIMERIIFIRT